MSTNEIAGRLTELLRRKQFLEAQHELFATHALNIEPDSSSTLSANGLEAIMAKEKRFQEKVQSWNRFEISAPLVSGNFFAIRMLTDVTLTNQQRFVLEELCVYEVKDGKIVREQFFY